MRYDSMVATAMALPSNDRAARAAQWRQLVDIVAQARDGLGDAARAAALTLIAQLRGDVPLADRRLAAAGLAVRADSAGIVAIFASDEAAVAAPVLTLARLDNTDWLSLIPAMPPASRALLRNRRDLHADVMRALASFGPSDFALPRGEDGGQAGDPGTQIRDLVARIEAFRLSQPLPAENAASMHVATQFAFETDVEGAIDWVAGTPREALVGLTIADQALAGALGVDGQAAGAFRRRAPFRDARLSVAGKGPASGDWLISATPIFNPRDGRFAGYNGSAHRPRPDQVATAPRMAGTTLPVDSLRQLIHELRTPLNAILGFAEMIDRQLLGPAASGYRGRAHEIVQEAQRLVEMVDDLDHAARAGGKPQAPETGFEDVRAMIERVAAHFAPTLEARQVRLDVDAPESVNAAGVSPNVLERMLSRLIGAALGLAEAEEVVAIALHDQGGNAVVSVARPAVLAGVPDAELLDPGYDADATNPNAPLLGLGFTLRLIGNLARDAGGRFDRGGDRFVLTLPGQAQRGEDFG